jgi:sodium/bile acid cotransporter 7
MQRWLTRRWFLISLLAVIPGGLWLGAALPPDRFDRLVAVIGPHTSTVLTIVVLFLMSVTLDNRQLWAALRRPGPVLWATVVTYVLVPLAAWPLIGWQLTPDFAAGLMIAASVPSTMAAASMWTRKAGGNDAVSLLVTLITNGACFLVTPVWLTVVLSGEGGSRGPTVELDAFEMMRDLIVSALFPIAAGQLCRLFPLGAAVADRRKVACGAIAQLCILAIVLLTSIKGGPRVRDGTEAIGGVAAIALVWACCVALHLAAMAVAAAGARLLGFSRQDRIAVAFAASQKTLPIGVSIANTFVNYGLPFAVFPMLMYHASQLFIDTAVADRMAAAPTSECERPPGNGPA